MPEHLSFQEVINQYPSLADFFPANQVAQLLGNRRLPSAEEKIEMFGGITQVSDNIRYTQELGTEIPYIILLSCDRNPMTTFEIVRFAYIATEGKYVLPVTALHPSINNLVGEGLLNSVTGITLIHRLKSRDYRVISDGKGYSITGGKALEKRVALLTHQEGGQVSNFVPQPRPI